MPSNPTEARPLRILVIDDEANIRVTLGSVWKSAVTRWFSAPMPRTPWPPSPVSHSTHLSRRAAWRNQWAGLIPLILAESPWAKIVVITAYASAETAIIAMDRGAADYLPKPFTPPRFNLSREKWWNSESWN